ncbi:MAG: hypothetical protein KAS72_10760 [Phycisphaerales bacterium]|nr:hypothetical protein [Phycisphaerales bacterium]
MRVAACATAFLTVLSAPGPSGAQDAPGPDDIEPTPENEPVIETIHTRFYWPRYASASVVVETLENDRTTSYEMELFVTPMGDDLDRRSVRVSSHRLVSLDGIAAVAESADFELAQFRLKLMPTRHLDTDGSYLGCDDVSELIAANLALADASDQFDALTTGRLRTEIGNSAAIRSIREQAAYEMLEWVGLWSDIELVKGEPKVIERHTGNDPQRGVSYEATYLWSESIERDGRPYERFWYRCRLQGKAFRTLAAGTLQRMDVPLTSALLGEQIITISVITAPYTLMPVEVTSQYNTVVDVAGEQLAHISARRVTFVWRQGKDGMTRAGDEVDSP